MRFEVRGQTALVTGANRGIGRAIVESLLEHGAAKVYAAVRKPASAAALTAAHGDRVVPLEFDLTSPATIAAAAKRASDVSLVVNNAGVLRTEGPLSAGALDALAFELDTNVYGLLRVAQAFAPVLKANGGGALVQLNSVASLRAFPPFSTYCASKAAAYSLTQSLRAVLAEQGTLVVSVHPGPIKTDMGHEAGLDDIAEPPSLVGEAVVAALAAGEFHAFPDSMARQMWSSYESFARGVVEASDGEG
ncbi:MAG TPA: SDR family oxidoreductase [Lacipirellulaceae bacterium]|nr:SDR family oxidoreductase [Lacipirellulaceae bacterium]